MEELLQVGAGDEHEHREGGGACDRRGYMQYQSQRRSRLTRLPFRFDYCEQSSAKVRVGRRKSICEQEMHYAQIAQDTL